MHPNLFPSAVKSEVSEEGIKTMHRSELLKIPRSKVDTATKDGRVQFGGAKGQRVVTELEEAYRITKDCQDRDIMPTLWILSRSTYNRFMRDYTKPSFALNFETGTIYGVSFIMNPFIKK